MKCPKCNADIGECRECPFCGYEIKEKNKDICQKCGKQGNAYFEGMCKECYDEKYGNRNEEIEYEEEDKARFLFICKIIISIILIIAIIGCIVSKLYIYVVALIVMLITIYITIQIFETIISLLQDINNKL